MQNNKKDKIEYTDPKEKLAVAIFRFFDSYPLYYYILASLMRVEFKNSKHKTMAVGFTSEKDETVLALFYHPDFVMNHSITELSVVLQHEVQHIGLKHLFRIGNKNPDLINMAMDVVVNYFIKDFKTIAPEVYKKSCTADKYPTLKDVDIRETTCEEVYNKLKNDPEAQKQQGKGQGSCHEYWVGVDKDGKPIATDKDGNPIDTQGMSPEQQAVLDKALKEAINKMGDKHAGNIPGEMQRMIDELKRVKTNWRHHISLFAQTVAQDEKRQTWKKRNRRLQYAAPGTRTEFKPKLLVVIDNSGSTAPFYDTFIAHICKISEYVKTTGIGVDTRVNFEYEFEYGKIPPNFKDKCSGGGTVFQPAFDYANEKKFDGIIYLTDGWNFDDKLNTYNIPVLFAISPDGKKMDGYRNIVLTDEKADSF